MTKQKTFLILALIAIAGLIPITIYFLEVGDHFQTADVASLPSRSLTPFEQSAQAFAGLVIKPIYMMLSIVIILALMEQTSADLSALRWGQIAFLAGETFCAVNFYIYRHESILSEYLHSYGMALAFGFTSFAFLEGLDSRILKLRNSRSAHEAFIVASIARFVLLILAFLTLIPLLSPIQPEAYTVYIFGFPYSYTRFDIYEIYERRVLPVLALMALIIAWIPLLRNSEPHIPFITKLFACAGLGALSFSFFRLVLNAIFVQNLIWFEFWEEATELMFVSAIGFVLWQFKMTLLEKTPILEGFGFHRRSQSD